RPACGRPIGSTQPLQLARLKLMDHDDHVELLRAGIPGPGGAWADLGAGSGAFTLALAELVGSTAQLHAVDRDPRSLERNARAMAAHAPLVPIEYHEADFTQPLDLPPLDGIVM